MGHQQGCEKCRFHKRCRSGAGVLGRERLCAGVFTQSRPILCNPLDCSPPVSSGRGSFQARIPEQVAVSYPRGIFSNQRSNLSCQAGSSPPSQQGSPTLHLTLAKRPRSNCLLGMFLLKARRHALRKPSGRRRGPRGRGLRRVADSPSGPPSQCPELTASCGVAPLWCPPASPSGR